MSRSAWSYDEMRQLVESERLPLMIVDLDILDANVDRLRAVATEHGKRLRLATKSVRVPALIRYILERGGGLFHGLMCYCLEEARLLASMGLDDLLIAYPTVRRADLEIARGLVRNDARLTLMIDCAEHVDALDSFWSGTDDPPLRVCIDVDMSYRPLGGHVHIGVRRSPIRTLEAFLELVREVRMRPRLRLAGVMGYEAQIAGLPDRNPFAPLLNSVKRFLKHRSAIDVASRRAAIARALGPDGVDFFNGGGTGSVTTTPCEPSITEFTAGSGFLQSHLFDYYASNRNQAAMCFALSVARVPEPGVITCSGGGYIASGECSPDKAPVPFLPPGLYPFAREGFGEVQTPLLNRSGRDLRPGDPIFFRPAKAGEIAERFSEYALKRGDRIVDRVPTYRGLGQCFF